MKLLILSKSGTREVWAQRKYFRNARWDFWIFFFHRNIERWEEIILPQRICIHGSGLVLKQPATSRKNRWAHCQSCWLTLGCCLFSTLPSIRLFCFFLYLDFKIWEERRGWRARLLHLCTLPRKRTVGYNIRLPGGLLQHYLCRHQGWQRWCYMSVIKTQKDPKPRGAESFSFLLIWMRILQQTKETLSLKA